MGRLRGEARAAARLHINQRPTEGPEDRPLGERCITGFNSGPPMLPAAYNMNVQIFQTADHVVLFNEMVHNPRIIPLDGSDHGTIPQWTGVSRGHWEGDTLVVETKNFRRETSFRNSSANLHLVERIQRREGLKLPARQLRRGRLWLSDGSCVRLRPERRN